MTIGTVNATEFFLTVAVSITFLLSLGFSAFTEAAVGLLIGGVAAAPFGALVAKRIPTKPLLVMVGIVLTVTYNLPLRSIDAAHLQPLGQGWLRTDPGMLAEAGGLDGFFVARFRA